jgi:hypothetical protein
LAEFIALQFVSIVLSEALYFFGTSLNLIVAILKALQNNCLYSKTLSKVKRVVDLSNCVMQKRQPLPLVLK